MSKIDTQGMSLPVNPNEKEWKIQPHKPWEITPRRCHTPQMVKELKILINEVLDEREGRFNYTSYFDVDKYKYYVDEEEPEYKPNKGNSYLRLDEIQE
mgnify:CR=1 FL=1